MRLISKQIFGRFGRCGACMRVAFAAALSASGAAALAAALAVTPAAVYPILALAILLTGNWLAHLAAFAASGAPADADPGRRGALAAAAKLIVIGVAVSIPVATWSTTALAFCGKCTKNEDCGDGFVCRNTAAVNSGEVCNECVQA
jgi:hypothetical protein